MTMGMIADALSGGGTYLKWENRILSLRERQIKKLEVANVTAEPEQTPLP